MSSFNNPNFGPIITAMVTPFKESNKHEIDYPAVSRLVEHLVKHGSDSIIIAGTTGESPTITHDEEIELLKHVQADIKRLGTKTKIIFGAGSNSTQTSIKMSQTAEKLGADGLLIVTPYYNKPNQKGLREHYSLIAQATSLPIILYNVPSRTNIALTADTIIELHEKYPHICSLKEASANLDIITRLRLKLSPEKFSIYCGDDSLTLPMLAVGACGVISVASHLVGNEMQAMVKAFKAGNHVKALEIHQEIFPIFDNLFIEPNPTCIKEALGIMGICSAILREPLVPLSDEQRAKLKKIINSVVDSTSLV
jgi:4-hydroxy-tetrahydrodipicolinate synthase